VNTTTAATAAVAPNAMTTTAAAAAAAPEVTGHARRLVAWLYQTAAHVVEFSCLGPDLFPAAAATAATLRDVCHLYLAINPVYYASDVRQLAHVAAALHHDAAYLAAHVLALQVGVFCCC
jgi:hypothetical protein